MSIDYSENKRRIKEPLRIYLDNRTKSDPFLEIEVLILCLVGIMRELDDLEDSDIPLGEDEEQVISKHKIQGDLFEHVSNRISNLYFTANPKEIPSITKYVVVDED